MLKNMTVASKLISGFLIVSILGAIVAGIGIFNMGRINDKADQIYEMELMGLSHIKEANINLIYIGRARGNYLLATSEEEREKNAVSIKKYLVTLKQNLEKAKPLFVSDKAKLLFVEYENVSQVYEKDLEKVLSLGAAEKLSERSEALSQILVETRKQANAMDELLTELSRLKEERAKEAAQETTQLYESSRMFMIILVIASALAGMALGILITRNLTRQLGGEPAYATEIAGRIADGDLTVRIDTKADDRSSMLYAMKEMRDNLVKIVSQVRSGTDTIATASGQIASGNLDLSSRTEQQASSLEETASSMEELTSTVRQNADNAKQANQLAVSASDIAIKGGEVVSQVVHTMDEINESAKKIVDIITVIDGIAFQTNILALNAAVEAARAGEQGRGFAVVASEVRSLAQRSASAAKEIKELIGNSVEKVENGSKLVEQAGSTMQDIVESIKRVNDIMAEITAAGQEQSSGIEQVNQAITQMDQVTQQNAALVEEAAAASQSLQDQAGNLSQLVSVFKLDGMQTKTSGAQIAVAGKAVPRSQLTAPRTASAKATTAASDGSKTKKLTAVSTSNNDGWEEF